MKSVQSSESRPANAHVNSAEPAVADPQATSIREAAVLDPLLLAADFKGLFSGAPVGIDEDCKDCD